MTAIDKQDAAVRAGLAAYADGFEAQRNGRKLRPYGRAKYPPRQFGAPALREMWIHGWNAAVAVEFEFRARVRARGRQQGARADGATVARAAA